MSAALASPLAKFGAWAAFVGPVAATIGRLAGEGHWVDDLPAIRALGLAQVGAEGLVSSALSAIWVAVPVGDRMFRLGLACALLVGFGGYLTYRLCLDWIDRAVTPTLSVLVALGAALTAGLGPVWQARGAGIGRGALAECLLLLFVASVRRPGHAAYWSSQAVLLGLICAEQRGLAPTALAVGVAAALASGRTPSLGEAAGGAALFGVTCLIAFAPSFVEMFGSAHGLRLGLEFGLPASRALLAEPLLSQVGWYTGGLVGVEVVSRLIGGRGSLLVGPLVLLFCSAWPGRADGAAAAVSVAAALGGCGFVQLISWLSEARIAFVRSALGLAALFHLSSVALAAEDGRRAVERQSVNGTRAWSRAAFDQLPPRSLLLVNSPDAVWRLWAAQTIEGTRPDVVVVPAPLLTRGVMARQLLALEPRLNRVIRDLAVGEVASEYALSEIADARPVRVELDADWPPRVLTHLVSDGVWFRLAPEALGRSDRALAVDSLNGALVKVLGASRSAKGRDDATISRLIDDAFAHAVVAAALGEAKTAHSIISQLGRLAPEDPRWPALATELEERPRGFSDLRGIALRR